jgi:hypothetical protein
LLSSSLFSSRYTTPSSTTGRRSETAHSKHNMTNEFFHDVIQLVLPTYLNSWTKYQAHCGCEAHRHNNDTKEVISDCCCCCCTRFHTQQDIIINSVISVIHSSGGCFVRPIMSCQLDRATTTTPAKTQTESMNSENMMIRWSYVSINLIRVVTLEHIKLAASYCHRKQVIQSIQSRPQPTNSNINRRAREVKSQRFTTVLDDVHNYHHPGCCPDTTTNQPGPFENSMMSLLPSPGQRSMAIRKVSICGDYVSHNIEYMTYRDSKKNKGCVISTSSQYSFVLLGKDDNPNKSLKLH